MNIEDKASASILCAALLAWVIALTCFGTAAHAQTQGERATCQSPQYVVSQIKAEVPIGVFARIGEEDFPGFLKRLNAMPPVSNIDADMAITFSVPDQDQLAVIFFKDGCVGKFVMLPEKIFDDLVTGEPT